ncbi:MAG: hypothetical protein AAB225_25450 [Acidobacteriota bacterium]
MRDAIEAGSILIERGTPMPDAWLPQGGPSSNGWTSVGKLDRSGLEASIRQAGWTFFYLAGEIRATVFGFDQQEAVLKAIKRLITNVKAQRLNCLEITRVALSSFLGAPYVTVAGHARHIQEGLVLSRATTPPDKTGSPPAVRSSIRRQRSEITEERLFAEEAVAAWEDEGGAPGHMGGRLAA